MSERSEVTARSRWAAAVLSGLVVVTGLAASVSAGLVLAAEARHAAELQVDRRTDLVRQAVDAQTARYLDQLRTVAAALGAAQPPTAAAFTRISEPLEQMHLPGATSLGFLVPATDRQVAAVQQRWRARGVAGLVLSPHGTGQEHIFGIFRRPLDGTARLAAGGDATQSPEPTRAMLEARRTGQVTVTGAFGLRRDQSLPPGRRQLTLSMTAPVYGLPDAAGHRVFVGWVALGLRGQDFVGAVLSRISQGTVDVALRVPDGGGTWSPVAALHATAGRQANLHRHVELVVARRRWLLDVDAVSASLPGGGHRLALTAVLLGLVLTGLLAALVRTLATARARAEARVLAATARLTAGEAEARRHEAELAETNQRLAAELARRKAVEVQLRQRQAELAAFSGVVAHDLKAPLGGIRGFAEMIGEEIAAGAGPAVVLPLLARVDRGVTRMAALIDNLLAYATTRDIELELVEVDLTAAVREVVAEQLDALPDTGSVRPEIRVGTLPPVQADPVLVRQLLHNLLHNAVRYTVDGQVPRVEITGSVEQGSVLLEVADHGLGIPAGQHDAIFATFHRAHPRSGLSGTGLGLSICRRILLRHGGTIVALDNPGGGARFQVTLPASLPVAESGRSASAA